MAKGSFKPVASEFAISFHMANGRFNGTAVLDHRLEPACDAASLPGSPDWHTRDDDATIAALSKAAVRVASPTKVASHCPNGRFDVTIRLATIPANSALIYLRLRRTAVGNHGYFRAD